MTGVQTCALPIFSKKIIYIILKKKPENLIKINKYNFNDANPIKVSNAIKRENFQRNFILEGLKLAKKNDIIILSDIDEIPKLDKFNFKAVSNVW